MRWVQRCLVALALIAAGFVPASAQSQKRVALIIANANYDGYRQLPNASVDAGLVSAALRRVGFEVEQSNDLGIAQFRTALGRFQARASGAGLALVYFAGHGLEAGGKNWLIPADARLATDAELDFQAIEANLVIRAAAGAAARIVVLDACRDNPFAGRMRSTGVYRVTRASGGGLSALDVQSARGTLLMYSAASGEVANDGAPGQGSPFARAFAKHMPEPGVELRVAVGKIADAVFTETGSTQLPFTTTSLSGTEIYLAPRLPGSVERLRRENEAPPSPSPPQTASAPSSAGGRARAPGQSFRDCAVCPEMLWIQGGSYLMGSPSGDEWHSSDEGPQRRVMIQTFAASKYEITFEEWDACVRDEGCGRYSPDDAGWGRGRRPVINVAWNDAKEYLRWLNAPGRGNGKYRLLTEAEWEYVARAGSAAAWAWGDDPNGGCSFANGADLSAARMRTLSSSTCDDGVGARTALVGQYLPNAFGLHDTIGNVWEVVEDCSSASYHGLRADGSANPDGDCTLRMARGGSWKVDPLFLRPAFRGRQALEGRSDDGGFRIARTQ